MKYISLTRRYLDQPREEIFSFMHHHGETWQTPYEKLASLAKQEDWDFRRSQFKRPGQDFPILVGYLNFTFLRCQEQDKIVFSEDNSRACFNTGLQTPNEKDIYATFYRTKFAQERSLPDWTLYGFFDSYSDRLSDFRPLPMIATYIQDTRSLVFDTTCEIEENFDHLFSDNIDRLPEVLRDNPTLTISAIKGSIELLKEKIIRNYKIAIPHWFHDRIQLLLPLNLTDTNEADLALVAEKDPTAKLYRIKTFLTMDQAYMDARLITRPDRDWLNP